MSIAVYCTAVRDFLRSNLTNFYAGETSHIHRNCKVTYDEQPTADCGQEFIAIYGAYHQPNNKNLMQALDEDFGITIAVSRKIAVVPPDYRGELGYTNSQTLPPNVSTPDTDRWLSSWSSTEARCREIVKLVCGGNRYAIMDAANQLLTQGGPFTEPMLWLGTDAVPRPVGPEHFYSYADLSQGADPVFGLVMKVQLGGAVRMQPAADLDYEVP